MDVIVLFVIIGIIGSILRNAANKAHQPPPFPRRASFPGRTSFPVGTPGSSQENTSSSLESTDAGWSRQEDENRTAAPDPYAVASSGYGEDVADEVVDTMVESEPLQLISLDDEHKRRHELDLSESGFLNGIIISEILGPPKARKR